MNLEISLQAYRANSDPSIAISDAQAAWILIFVEEIVKDAYEEGQDSAIIQQDEVVNSHYFEEGRAKALTQVLAYIPNTEGSMSVKGLRRIVESLQSPTEKKCGHECNCVDMNGAIASLRNRVTHLEEHEEHQDTV